jgi:general secretion pathway protein K
MNPRIYWKILGKESGMALLITLSIIAILLTVSLELNRRVRLGILATQTQKTDYKLMEMAKSGMIIAKAILLKDINTNKIDSVQEEWSDSEALDTIVRRLFPDKGDIKLKIMDEMGKIQINALMAEYPGHKVNMDQKIIWENLLSFFISSDKSEDERDPKEIINCLIDWLDNKDNEAITGVSGAESDYYESLDSPYKCANRELSSLNELFLVKGITKDLLIKNKALETALSDPDTTKPSLGLGDLLTVFGSEKAKTGLKSPSLKKYNFSGKININTAPVPVIAAILPFGKQDLAQKINEHRLQRPDGKSDYANNLSIKDWYAGVAGLTNKEKIKMAKMITYSSHIFSIESIATLKGRSLVLKNVIVRQKDKKGKWACKTLRQQID